MAAAINPRLTSSHMVDILGRVIQISLTMKTATVRDLRNHFARIAGWIKQGEPVEITKAGKLFARLVPAAPEKPRRFKMPDIMARLQANFGDKVYDADELQELIQDSRGERS
jgi:antitoxin (DNA-binding transcriptional repressor) of toxin-antitoxin stability system